MNTFDNVKKGDTVVRMLCGIVPVNLVVTDVTNDRIICGAWEFDKRGLEIDDCLSISASHLVRVISA